ncbi:hypothetical protein [Caballeronia glebae]|uniref:hypothetical protein n=1 Tax=Caballeronia glebae TaxID=1777143 RepID=UPI0038BB68DA
MLFALANVHVIDIKALTVNDAFGVHRRDELGSIEVSNATWALGVLASASSFSAGAVYRSSVTALAPLQWVAASIPPEALVSLAFSAACVSRA